uniref:Dual specificity protein phosphatase 19 n=1 Tax=Stomoxys calcitrans TaxID=35570 RepID=A0A1I8PYL7_STOCA
MSLLDALQAKRSKLKSCQTIVTNAAGERFMENTSTQEMQKLVTDKTYGFVVDTKPDYKPACILEDFLYLGSQDAVTLENIEQYQLTHILTCLDLPEASLKDVIFKEAFDFIESARLLEAGRVLVHCNAGVSRSASVVIAYLMRYSDMDFEKAFKHVKSRRECIQPNAGFMRQLREFEQVD